MQGNNLKHYLPKACYIKIDNQTCTNNFPGNTYFITVTSIYFSCCILSVTCFHTVLYTPSQLFHFLFQ